MLKITEDISNYIQTNKDKNIQELILKGSPFKDVEIQFLVNQINARQRLLKKLPKWLAYEAVIFPPQINLEQTSSQETARYKSTLAHGKTLIDLTGGFGVDSYFWAKKFNKVIHIDTNAELIKLAKHNANVMEINNIEFLNKDSIDYLQELDQKVDCIFIDPSRRDQNKGRVFMLSDCSPNLIEHWKLVTSKTNQLIIKTSPLLDIKLGLKELENVKEIHIVSVKNEVKELLWIINTTSQNSVNKEPILKCVDLNNSTQMEFEGDLKHEKNAKVSYAAPQKYLYEPLSTIMKSGLFNSLGEFYQIDKLAPNTHLYTSNKLIHNFSGKVFEILDVLDYKTKLLKKRLKSKNLNVVKKNFPILVKDLIKKFKINEGGEDYVFFTTSGNKKIVILCKRIFE